MSCRQCCENSDRYYLHSSESAHRSPKAPPRADSELLNASCFADVAVEIGSNEADVSEWNLAWPAAGVGVVVDDDCIVDLIGVCDAAFCLIVRFFCFDTSIRN